MAFSGFHLSNLMARSVSAVQMVMMLSKVDGTALISSPNNLPILIDRFIMLFSPQAMYSDFVCTFE
jgi:hypothetical protein